MSVRRTCLVFIVAAAVLYGRSARAGDAATESAEAQVVIPASYAKQMERIVRIEGPEFSQVRYDHYRAYRNEGIAIAALGGVAAVAGGVWAFGAVRYGGDLERGAKNPLLGERWQQATCLALVLSGAVLAAIGVPLAILGRRGMKRQIFLRYKDENLRSFGTTSSLSILVDPERRTGGLLFSFDF